jgi:hypothetical protein
VTLMSQDTPIIQAIAYGVCTPNPHNVQASKFELTSDTEALYYLDEQRLLPATDPLSRQIHIGAGCAVETLAIGISGHGYTTEIEFLPQGAHGFEEIGHKPVARIALRSNATTPRDNLADAISRRQTDRRPYTGPLITDREAELLQRLALGDNIEVLVLHQLANEQLSWLKAGRTFARVHLGLTQLGFTCHPYSQVLEEYPEMAALQTELSRLLGFRAPEKIQMAIRIGRAEPGYVAPRRAPRDFLVGG